ncbi:Replication initiation protein, partial [Streptomyces sp. MCAF7]
IPVPASAQTPAGQTDGRPVGDRAGHPTDLSPGHRNIAGQRVDSDTTLVISHWQYAGTGLLPELEHLADLLAATPQTRPEQPTRTRRSKRSGDRAGHPVGHSTDRLTSAVRAGAVA